MEKGNKNWIVLLTAVINLVVALISLITLAV